MILPTFSSTLRVAGFLSPIQMKGDGNERLQTWRCLLVRFLVPRTALSTNYGAKQQNRRIACGGNTQSGTRGRSGRDYETETLPFLRDLRQRRIPPMVREAARSTSEYAQAIQGQRQTADLVLRKAHS